MSADVEYWHGTTNGYTNRGCRCADCREAWRLYHADYMARNPRQQAKHRLRELAAYQVGASSHYKNYPNLVPPIKR